MQGIHNHTVLTEPWHFLNQCIQSTPYTLFLGQVICFATYFLLRQLPTSFNLYTPHSAVLGLLTIPQTFHTGRSINIR